MLKFTTALKMAKSPFPADIRNVVLVLAEYEGSKLKKICMAILDNPYSSLWMKENALEALFLPYADLTEEDLNQVITKVILSGLQKSFVNFLHMSPIEYKEFVRIANRFNELEAKIAYNSGREAILADDEEFLENREL